MPSLPLLALLLAPALVADPAATARGARATSSGMEQVAPTMGNRTHIDTPPLPKDRAQVQIQTEPGMAGATRPSVNVTTLPAPAPANGQSAIMAQAKGTSPCQDPENAACAGEELQALKQQLSLEQALVAPSLDVNRVAKDPAKAIGAKTIDATTATILFQGGNFD